MKQLLLIVFSLAFFFLGGYAVSQELPTAGENLSVNVVGKGASLPCFIIHQDMVTHAEVMTRVELELESLEDQEVIVEITVKDPRGYAAAIEAKEVKLLKNKRIKHVQKIFFPHPLLWQGKDNPYLHNYIVSIKKRDKVIFQKEHKTGFRLWSKHSPGKGILNGHYVDEKEIQDIRLGSDSPGDDSRKKLLDELGMHDKRGQLIRLHLPVQEKEMLPYYRNHPSVVEIVVEK